MTPRIAYLDRGRPHGRCLKRVDLARRLRLLGVRIGKLARAGSPEHTGRLPAAGAPRAETTPDLFGPT